MRKHSTRLAAILCIVFGTILLSSCSGTPPRSVAKHAEPAPSVLLVRLTQKVPFSGHLKPLSRTSAFQYYGIPEEKSVSIAAAASDNTPENAAVWLAPSGATARRIAYLTGKHYSSQRDSYEGCHETQACKLDSAVVLQNGRYVFCCVSADNRKARLTVSHLAHQLTH